MFLLTTIKRVFHYPTPDKDGTTYETVQLNDARIGKTLSPTAINSLASAWLRLNRHSSENKIKSQSARRKYR